MPLHPPFGTLGNRQRHLDRLAPQARDADDAEKGVGEAGAPWGVRRAMLIATLVGLLVWLAIFLGLSLIVW